ncbi:hypothetical protein D9M71_39080 [compost metagenome]
MTRIEYSTRHPIEIAREEIAVMVSAFLASGGQITELDGFQKVERPRPSFNGKIDPDTVLKRNERYIRPLHAGSSADKDAQRQLRREAERAKIRAMTEAL